MGNITISIESPTAADIETMTELVKQVGIPPTALVVGGYDAITVTADLDEIRREQMRRNDLAISLIFGGTP